MQTSSVLHQASTTSVTTGTGFNINVVVRVIPAPRRLRIRIIGVTHGRPVDSVYTHTSQTVLTIADTCGRQIDGVAVGSVHIIALSGPHPLALIYELLYLLFGGQLVAKGGIRIIKGIIVFKFDFTMLNEILNDYYYLIINVLRLYLYELSGVRNPL